MWSGCGVGTLTAGGVGTCPERMLLCTWQATQQSTRVLVPVLELELVLELAMASRTMHKYRRVVARSTPMMSGAARRARSSTAKPLAWTSAPRIRVSWLHSYYVRTLLCVGGSHVGVGAYAGVAFWSNDKNWPEVVTHRTTRDHTTPSVITFATDPPTVGPAAVPYLATHPSVTVRNYKRLVGRRYACRCCGSHMVVLTSPPRTGSKTQLWHRNSVTAPTSLSRVPTVLWRSTSAARWCRQWS